MKKLAIILILWLPFSIGSLVAILVSLFAILAEKNEYGKNVLRAMDKTLAAVLGFTGYYTLSAECGVSRAPAWSALRWALNKIQAGHCDGAAEREGLKQQG